MTARHDDASGETAAEGAARETAPGPAAVQELSDWVIERGLAGGDLADLVAGFCERLARLGLPIRRGHVSMSALHPSFSAFGCTWQRERGVISERFEHGSEARERWLASPLRYMIERGAPRMRRRLDGPTARLDYPVLREFRDQGASDWLALLYRFGAAAQQVSLPGMITSWLADRPGGFLDEEIALLERVVPRLGLACYRIALEEVAVGLLDAYVGSDAGRRILHGQIKRGDVGTLSAAIFFADLRGFTRVADRMPGAQLIGLLNDRLGAVTDAIEAHGGQVLKFLGDGLLATFSLEGRALEAVCGDALDAAEDARAASAVLQRLHGLPPSGDLALDVALHLGEVMYGNVGSDRRLDFTIIGPAVNEVSRIEALCEPTGHSLLLSEDFARACGRTVVSLGRHRLRGVAEPKELFALAPTP